MSLARRFYRKTPLALAAILFLGVPTEVSQAANCTWNPATGNWSIASDWSCGIVPSGPALDNATIGSGKTVTVNTPQSIFGLVNAGSINIDASTFTLQGGGSTTNSGTINIGSAVAAALQMANPIDNTGGVINIADGSVLNQFSSAITAGTINMSGSGALVAFSNGGNALIGVTLNGLVDASSVANARLRLGNGMTLNGNVNIANGGIVSLDSSIAAANSIAGSGVFNLNDAGARLAVDGSGTTALGANIVVRGQGNLGQAINVGGNNTLTNNGLISADVAGGTLNVVPPANGGGSSLVNNGTVRAINGGTLLLSTNTGNAGGQISAQNGSAVVQNGVSISGGTIATSGTGVFRPVSSGSNFLDNVTVNGVVDMTTIGNSRDRIVNGATLNGAVNIANGGILSLDSQNSTGSAQTVSGTATINLNDPGARLAIDGTGATTLGPGITVRGQGNIGRALNTGGNNVLTLHGLVSADVSGGTLNIVPPADGGGSSIVNSGTLQAINGGTLLLSTNIAALAGSQIIAGTGSTVVQNGVRINGTFTSSGTGIFTVSSSASNFLDGITFSGPLDASSIANSRERFANGATINGAINIANGGIVSLDSASTASGNQTIGGNASFNLNDPGARLAVDGSGSTTLGANVVVHGQGNFGQAINTGGNNALTNNGRVSADVSGGVLNIVAPASGGGSTFVNNGLLEAINGGTLQLSTGITGHPGSQIRAGAGSVVLQNAARLSGVINTAGTGVLRPVSNASNFLDGVTLTGTLDATSVANSRERIVNGATINGAINIANGGIFSLDSQNSTGSAQTIGGNASFNLNDPSARLAVDGSGSTTLGANVVVHGQGNFGAAINTGGNNAVTNNGRVSADVSGGVLNIVAPANGGGSSFTNAGLLDARGGGTLLLSTGIVNTAGQIAAQTGSVVLQNGVTISGGSLVTSGTGAIQASSNGSNFLSGVALNGVLDMTSVANSRERLVNGAALTGMVNVANGGILSLDSQNSAGATQTIGGTAVINLNDPGARLAIDGTGSTTLAAGITVRGQGNIGQAINVGGNNTLFNNATIVADGGTLAITPPGNAGTLAGTGTLQTSGGALNLATSSASTQGRLVMGGPGSTLNLNNQNLTITIDYTNAQSGSGNAFDRRAGVSGSGSLLAGGDVAQAITGAGVTNGNTANATLTLGNVRVGSTTFNYQIANTGTTGPSLRGAIQTNVNGANLTDTRLSGSGVTPGNFDTGGPGSNTSNLAVTFTAANAGALAPLSGQVLNLRSNFDNIADQKLNIVLGSGAAAYNLAAAGAVTPSPVVIANQRVGGAAATGLLTISNTAPAGAFTERLNAAFGSTSGSAITNGGSIALLAGGASNSSSMAIGVDTSAAGARAGSVAINFASDGTGTSGLGITPLSPQTVNVSGNVFRLASASTHAPEPVTIANQHVGGALAQALTLSNTAVNDGFSEQLSASIAPATGPVTATGSFSLLNAGASNSSSLHVGVDTATAGAKAGTATITLQSGGVAGVSGLAAVGIGTQTVNVSGNVFRLASANTIGAVNFGAVHVGDTVTRALTITNTAANDGFSERLNASFGGTSDTRITTSGSISLLGAGATNSTGMVVGLNTAAAGTVSGTATVLLQSDGSGTSGLGTTALPSQNVGVSGDIQTLGQVFRLAQPSLHTPEPVNFGNVRVGTATNQNLTLSNLAANDGFSEKLNASIGAATAGITAGGSFTLLAPQATNSTSLHVGIDTASAGAKSGTATITLASDGTGTSGLGITPLSPQTVNVSGNVFRLASASAHAPETVTLANQHVGGALTQALTLSNTATNDGFSEQLSASIARAAGPVTATGSFSLLNAGASNNSSLLVGVDTATAGAKAGTATITLQSGGVAGVSGLAAVGIGTQTFNVSGNVYRLASANAIAAVDFGSVHVGDLVSRALTITNTAANDGFSERLNASFGDTSDTRITTSGSISLLGGGANNHTSMVVGLNTAAAGTVSGTATVLLQSDGTGTSGLGITDLPSQNVGVSGVIGTGQVFRLAQPSLHTPEPVSFGNVRVGAATNQNLTLSNLAANDGFSEKLNASIGAATAGITAGGSFTLLAPQAINSTSLHVGIDTASAGAKSGTATITLASDGTGTSGLGITPLSPQTVNVSGNVYRLAHPQLNTPAVDLVARVGAASPTASVSVTNVSPDAFTERLNVSPGAAPAGFSTSGSISGVTAGSTSTGLSVGLSTAAAGTFAGGLNLAFVSSGAGTTNAPDAAVGSQTVNLTGRVYTPAVAQLNTPAVDFGIVHRGDSVAPRTVSVTNAAAIAAPNDELRGSIGGASGPFAASGSLSGLAAQATDASSFQVALNTDHAGVFHDSATVTLASHDAELSDLPLGSSPVALSAQVDNFAQAELAKVSGTASLSHAGPSYVLDFGSLLLGAADASDTLAVLNSAIGPADLLAGSFDLSEVGNPFQLSGFGSFSGIGAGSSHGGLSLTFDSATVGAFDDTIVLHLSGSNASGYDAALPDITLELRGDVVTIAAVPEPGTYATILLGLAMIGAYRSRRLQRGRVAA